MSQAPLKLLLLQENPTWKSLLPPEFKTETAGHLAAGLELLGKQSFDLILLDITLPDAHELIAFNQVRAAATHTPIIILVDPLDEELAARAIWLGAADYLLKPELTASILAKTVHKTIVRHRAQLSHNHEGFLLQTLMDNIPDAVYFKDTRSRFLMLSRAQANKYHLANPQEAIGKSDADFFTKPHAEQALADEQAILRTGQPMQGIEESETWPDGSITWVSTTKMPLRNQSGRIVGTFGISRDITKRKLAELALRERTQQLHKKTQQIEEELKMARELQHAMLPEKFPVVGCGTGEPDALPEALGFYSYFIPSGAVSGDFFDVIQLSETSVGVFICDVMGHDVRAALVTAMLRALVEDWSQKATDPGQLLAEINKSLFKVFRQSGTTMYATAFYMVADMAAGRLSYASAAHPNPLQLKRCLARVDTLGPDGGGKNGPGLGLFKDSMFPTYQRQMNVDDVILLYTDGMIEEEGRNQELFSVERLADTIHKFAGLSTKEILSRTIAEIRQFSGRQELSDDICLVGVEVKRLKSD